MPKSAQPSIDACQATQFSTILIFLGLLVFTLPTDQFNATFQPPLTERITVVPLIRYDADGILPRPTTIHPSRLWSFQGMGPFFSPGQTAIGQGFWRI